MSFKKTATTVIEFSDINDTFSFKSTLTRKAPPNGLEVHIDGVVAERAKTSREEKRTLFFNFSGSISEAVSLRDLLTEVIEETKKERDSG